MKQKNFFKKVFLNPYFWITFAIFLYMSPALLKPHFSYIDDGQSLMTAKKALESNNFIVWKDSLFESSLGRLRPSYHLYLIFLYLVAGVNPFIFWLGQTLVILGTVIGLWKFFEDSKFINKKLLSFLISIFLFLPASIDNFYRLGTAEPRQVLGIIWLLVWLKKLNLKKITLKNFIIGNLLLLFTLTTKETSLLMLPLISIFFFAQWILHKNHRKNIFLLFLSMITQGVIFFLLIPKLQGYTSTMSFSLSRLWNSLLITRLEFAEYYLPLVVAVLGTIFRFMFQTKQKTTKIIIEKFLWPAIFISGIISSLIFVFSWQYQLERYHYLPLVFVLFYLVYEFSQWRWKSFSLQNWKKLSFIFLPAIILFILFFQMRGLSWINLFQRSYNYWYFQYNTYQTAGNLISFLYNELPDNTTVYIDHDDYEKIADLGYFATNLGDRSIKIYSNNKKIHDKFPKTQFYSEDLLKMYKETKGNKVFVNFDLSSDRYFTKITKNF